MIDKDEIKNRLTDEMIFDIVCDFGGEPKLTSQGFVSATICHNHPGEGSHKLYYYNNTKLFRCYTECDASFDIFDLICKVMNLRAQNKTYGLYYAIKWVCKRFNFTVQTDDEEFFAPLDEWKTIERNSKIQSVDLNDNIELPEYDATILKYLPAPIIAPWVKEGITIDTLRRNNIKYYPPDEQIVIPHYDVNNRLVGIRGRALGQLEGEIYGKYRPLCIGNKYYNHPLGLNLYNLNNSKTNIQKIKKVIIVEGEKSCLQYQSYFGAENDITVACCGSSVSSAQIRLLLQYHPDEIMIAFDRQYQAIGDDEYKHWVKHLKSIYTAFNRFVTISFIFDKENLLQYKQSPTDAGKETFLKLYNKRVKI